MNKLYFLILLGLFACSPTKEIVKEEVKIEQREVEVEGKEYALSDIDSKYEDEEIIVFDTLIVDKKDTLSKAKIKVKVAKTTRTADIEIITTPTFIRVPDTTTTIVMKEEDSWFKDLGYWVLVFLFLVAIILFLFKIR